MSSLSDSRQLLSITATARILGVSRRTAYALVKAGALPVCSVGGLKKVPAGALAAWLAEREAEALASVRRAA